MSLALNWTGVAAGLAALTGIAFGHVMVRYWEERLNKLLPAILISALAGVGFLALSLLQRSDTGAAVCGILGITFLWDGIEFFRQQKRVRKGHAPANPRNPRHAAILRDFPEATTIAILDREAEVLADEHEGNRFIPVADDDSREATE